MGGGTGFWCWGLWLVLGSGKGQLNIYVSDCRNNAPFGKLSLASCLECRYMPAGNSQVFGMCSKRTLRLTLSSKVQYHSLCVCVWLQLHWGPWNGTLQLPSVCVRERQMLHPVVKWENATAISQHAQNLLHTAVQHTLSTPHSTCLHMCLRTCVCVCVCERHSKIKHVIRPIRQSVWMAQPLWFFHPCSRFVSTY